MDTTRKLWLGLGALLVASFGILLWMGRDVHLEAPPLPQNVVSESGHVLYTREDLERGRPPPNCARRTRCARTRCRTRNTAAR